MKKIEWKAREAREAKQTRRDFGKLKPFLTSAPDHFKYDGGYGGGPVNPSRLADILFEEEISGAWLCCYMLRRFGWPNIGSDDYKELMTWALTTAVPGLYLSVTPYLGGSNLHFGVLFESSVGRKMDSDPGRDHYFTREYRFIMRWWKTIGIKLYAWGVGLKKGDSDELVHEFGEAQWKRGATAEGQETKCVYGLWRRTEKIKGRRDIPAGMSMKEWWIGELIAKRHPEVKLPKMTRWERANARRNPFRRRCEAALWRTMLDLLRPTNVRDVSFNIFGKSERPEQTYAKKPKPEVAPAAHYWPGAGDTPEYYYSTQGKKDRITERKKSTP